MGTLTHLDEVWTHADVRMNEGGCDPDGRFYCGSMAYDKQAGAAALYRLDPDRSVRHRLERLDWSPDGSGPTTTTPATQRVAIFDYDSESGLTGRRTLVEIAEESGGPDGFRLRDVAAGAAGSEVSDPARAMSRHRRHRSGGVRRS
jgi:sugar lactone lactonase YvrE